MNLKIMNFQVEGFLIYFLKVGQISPIGHLRSVLKSPYGLLRHYYFLISNQIQISNNQFKRYTQKYSYIY